jgi:hypothetical protein
LYLLDDRHDRLPRRRHEAGEGMILAGIGQGNGHVRFDAGREFGRTDSISVEFRRKHTTVG